MQNAPWWRTCEIVIITTGPGVLRHAMSLPQFDKGPVTFQSRVRGVCIWHAAAAAVGELVVVVVVAVLYFVLDMLRKILHCSHLCLGV